MVYCRRGGNNMRGAPLQVQYVQYINMLKYPLLEKLFLSMHDWRKNDATVLRMTTAIKQRENDTSIFFYRRSTQQEEERYMYS